MTLSASTDDDGTDEPDGSVTVTVGSGAGYTIGRPASATIAVTDDDGPQLARPVVTIAAVTSAVVEGADVTFTLTATPAPAAPLTVNVSWTEEGSFLTGTRPPAVTIPATGRVTLSASTDDDGTAEPDGSVTVTVGSGAGYTIGRPASATIAVTDNDGPQLARPW